MRDILEFPLWHTLARYKCGTTEFHVVDFEREEMFPIARCRGIQS